MEYYQCTEYDILFCFDIDHTLSLERMRVGRSRVATTAKANPG